MLYEVITLERLVDEGREFPVFVRTADDIDDGFLLEQILTESLGHAAENAHHQVRILLLEMLEVRQPSVDPLFGVVRITSYNVCYTKLLRVRPGNKIGIENRDEFALGDFHPVAKRACLETA